MKKTISVTLVHNEVLIMIAESLTLKYGVPVDVSDLRCYNLSEDDEANFNVDLEIKRPDASEIDEQSCRLYLSAILKSQTKNRFLKSESSYKIKEYLNNQIKTESGLVPYEYSLSEGRGLVALVNYEFQLNLISEENK